MRPRHRSLIEFVVDHRAVGRDRDAGLLVLVIGWRHDRHAAELELLVHFDRPQHEEGQRERRLVLVFVEQHAVERALGLEQRERLGRRRLQLLDNVAGSAALEQLQLRDDEVSFFRSPEATVALPGGLFI